MDEKIQSDAEQKEREKRREEKEKGKNEREKEKEGKPKRVKAKGKVSGPKESCEKSGEKKISFLAREKDIRHTYFSSRPIFMLECKGAYINFSDIDPPMPSCAMSLL